MNEQREWMAHCLLRHLSFLPADFGTNNAPGNNSVLGNPQVEVSFHDKETCRRRIPAEDRQFGRVKK